ncbi:hypothetical protein Egran_01860 [Elaphomyces granulatus]|uniref:ADF-H domain-containing protein n=1 Tax=Elaphomyces granulatus TaxID=519963 RepID=A0A232M213_9EURO|nr:hypothetical protein Egran_01860 [Elaphomyces granulatus]
MQSGITVSPELHDAFTSFSSASSLFCLPITITSESLTPLPPVPFSSSSSFYDSLPRLSSILQPKTPIYLILRHGASTLIALTHIPSNAPVRSKTLFAATRATLVRDLGSENFATTVFTTEEDEVLSEQVWRERDIEGNGGNGRAGFKREDVMDERERELEAVRRAEEEAGRDAINRGTMGKNASGGMNFAMPVDEDARGALKGLGEGGMVQLSIDIPSETIKLASAQQNVPPNSVATSISESSPQYTFYHYPGSEAVVFIYTCPSAASIKERMLYASSRRVAVNIGQAEGLNILKKIEGSSPDEITEARLHEKVHPPRDEGPSRAFARPKRPGR